MHLPKEKKITQHGYKHYSVTRIFIELKVPCTKAPFSALKSLKRVILTVQSYRLQLVILPGLKHWLLTMEYSVRKSDSVPPDFT